MKYISSLLMFVIATWAMWMMTPGWAQAGSGFYVSGEVGANFATGLDTTGTSNDRPSVCDEYINPLYDEVENSDAKDSNGKLYSEYNCTGSDRGAGGRWKNEFEGATGILAGAAAGYSFAGQNPNSPLGGLRVELEYFYRQSNYDQTADIPFGVGTQGDKLRDEIVQATDRIGSITSHNLFGNLFYDFANTSRFTPYIGVGGGVGFTDMEYGSVWVRNEDSKKADDSYRITTGEGLPNYDEIRRELAKTVSVGPSYAQRRALWGSRSCSGWITRLRRPRRWGSKGRWVRFGSFSDDFIWNPLRTHEPNLRTRRKRTGIGQVQDQRHRVFRRQREPEVPFLDHSDFPCLGMKIANVSPNLLFICHSCPFPSVIPAVCKRESSLGFWGVDRVQGKGQRLWILDLDPRLQMSGTSVEDDREWSETSPFHLLICRRQVRVRDSPLHS